MLPQPNTRLWKVFWLWGAPVAGLTAALVWASERAYGGGHPALGALAGLARLLVYLFWFHAVWRCSRNVERALWTYLARGALVAGLAASALLY